jgi:hypothetical protein
MTLFRDESLCWDLEKVFVSVLVVHPQMPAAAAPFQPVEAGVSKMQVQDQTAPSTITHAQMHTRKWTHYILTSIC